MTIRLPVFLVILFSAVFAEGKDSFEFLLGEWSGEGTGFGNEGSTITASFQAVMNGNYIEVKHRSDFIPTEKKPAGEVHEDWGMISYDKNRDIWVYRQFNIEGFVNQYVLIDSLSNEKQWVFETEVIENFVPGGKARWTIYIRSENEMETSFDLSFPGKEYACFGTNRLIRKP